MKNKLNKKNRITQNAHYNSQGITLVALIITIILLLILAGVAINMAVDSDGLFAKANEAADEWNTKVGEEEETINDLLGKLETMGTEEDVVIEKPNDEDIIASYDAGDNIKLYVVPANQYLADNTKVASIQTSDVAKIAAEVSEEYMLLFVGIGEMWERDRWVNEADSYYERGNFDYPCDYVRISYGITNISANAFSKSPLKRIIIPSSVTTIESSAFSECSSLTSIVLPNGLLTLEEYAFWQCSSLRSMTLPNTLITLGMGAFEYCSSLRSITIPNGLLTLNKCTFLNCSSLTSITIPSNVETIGGNVFGGCTGTVFLQGRTVVPSDWPSGWNGNMTIKLDTVDDNAQ